MDKQVISQLDTAYATLLKEGVKVTVRSLRAEAGVSTAAVAEYLKQVRNNEQVNVPELPANQLEAALGPLWVAAYGLATEMLKTEHEAELESYRASELEAVEAMENANKDANLAEAETLRLTEEIAQLSLTIKDLRTHLTTVEAESRQEREKATQALERAARAEATAETLQKILNNESAVR